MKQSNLISVFEYTKIIEEIGQHRNVAHLKELFVSLNLDQKSIDVLKDRLNKKEDPAYYSQIGREYYSLFFHFMSSAVEKKNIDALDFIYKIMEKNQEFFEIAPQTPAIKYLLSFQNICKTNNTESLLFFVNKFDSIGKSFGLAPYQKKEISKCKDGNFVAFLKKKNLIDENDFLTICFPNLEIDYNLFSKDKDSQHLLKFSDNDKKEIIENLFDLEHTQASQLRKEIKKFIKNLKTKKENENLIKSINNPDSIKRISSSIEIIAEKYKIKTTVYNRKRNKKNNSL